MNKEYLFQTLEQKEHGLGGGGTSKLGKFEGRMNNAE